MKKNLSLAPQGLILSSAQSISNLMHQRALDINAQIEQINNCSKSIKINGEIYVEQNGFEIPKSIIALIMEKAELHSAQAFLRENMKAKDDMLKELKNMSYRCSAESPVFPVLFTHQPIRLVDENWGWEQLTTSEMNEFLEMEAFASHIGQFIHKGGKLDRLRSELPNLKTLEWIEIKQGEKSPMLVNIHHTPDLLLAVHNSLATEHRKYEQRVNYFKAKVKNLVTEENARIANVNANALKETEMKNAQLNQEYIVAANAYSDLQKRESQEFEADRQSKIRDISSLRISVDPRFKTIIDHYMTMMDSES